MWKWIIILVLIVVGIWFFFFKKSGSAALKNFAGGGGGQGVASSVASPTAKNIRDDFKAIDDATGAQQNKDITSFATSAVSFNLVGVYNSFKSLWTGSGNSDDVQKKIEILIEYALAGDKNARFTLSANYPDIAKQYGIYNIREGGPAFDIKEVIKNASK